MNTIQKYVFRLSLSHKTLNQVLLCCCLMLMFAAPQIQAAQLTVYSSRAKHLITPFFKDYEKQTGIKINHINGDAGILRQRLLLEKENTQADIFLTVDAGNLWKAAEEGLLAQTPSKILNKNIPKHLRDTENQWFALTIRARTFVYSPELVSSDELTNYRDLAKPQWKNRLCLRTSKKVYNQSLVAMLIHHFGVDTTDQIVQGWVNNLAHKPYAKDSHVIQAVARQECAIALVNSYYYGRRVAKDPQFSNQVKLAWAGQGDNDFGTHVNVSGAGVVKHSDNKKQALEFLEWLSKVDVQHKFAAINLEYPVNKNAERNDLLKGWGSFREDKALLFHAGENQVKAVKLMDRAGYK